MDHDTAPSGEGFVTLYAGPLDGLVLTAAHLDRMAQDRGSERYFLLTNRGVTGLYQEVDGRWVYATPRLPAAPDQPTDQPEEPA
ncbi:hypothetical protein TM51_06062 [Thermobifida fusca TM51]|uniref:Uncharacterized protein n=1 Tax=Thermobifida fusca TM51 TaxID=1169414 RepID=A0A9P2TB44_THEFU|nr:hypothetical protein [Thermobifida fusca]EOR71750.1 hypothetical protein TM51_06062 [Thermobifida fusca TM51]